jgi:hypothetical protein
MQDILLPLLVFNLLLTFWLLRQHILRQGRRHRRRNRIDRWLNDLQLEIRGHDQALINHGEIFLEHRSAMAEINKDHYAINERLDGISVYDIKAILAGQERIQALESDIEAIKDFISPYEARLSYFESAVNKSQAHDNFSGRSIWDVASLTSAVGDLRQDFLRLERDLTVISQSNLSVNDRTCKLESELKRIEELVVGNARVASLWMAEVNGEIAVLKNNFDGDDATISNLRNSHETLSATVETLRIQHSGLACETDLRFVNHVRRICSIEEWLARHTKFPLAGDDVALVFNDTITKIDADILLVKNELDSIRSRIDAQYGLIVDNKVDTQATFIRIWKVLLENKLTPSPFNPDTLIDSILNPDRKVPRGTILLSGDDIIKYGDEICFDPSFDWEEPINSSVGKTVSEVSASIGHTVMVRRTLIPTDEQTLESDRQEETADPVKYSNRFPNKHKQPPRPLANETPAAPPKPNTDYTHDIIP